MKRDPCTFRVKCAVCGKLTAGRLPRKGRHEGDGTLWYPRRHNCPGDIIEGILVEVKKR